MRSAKSLTFASGYTGSFDFSGNTLTLTGNADFRGGETLVPGGGALAFTGVSAQAFYPKTGQAFPDLIQNGAGGTTHSGTGTLTAANFILTSGPFNMGTGFTDQVASVSGSGILHWTHSFALHVLTGAIAVVGHYARYPWGESVSAAECDLLKQPLKFMCVNLPTRRACAGNLQIPP